MISAHLSADPSANLDAIFKAYDIRGVVDSEISEEVCFAVGAAFAVYSREQGTQRIVVGRDMRPRRRGFIGGFLPWSDRDGC